MNNNDLLDAIGGADARFKQEVMDHMNKSTARKPSPARRTLRLIPAVAALICLLGVTVYAAVNYWGIFDFQKESLRPFPTDAQEIVQPQTETGSLAKQDEAGSQELVTCKLIDSVNDGRQLNLTVRMESAQPGKYVLMFQDYYPELPADYFGADYDGTIGEYAKAHDMTLLYVSASIKNDAGLGTGVESILEKPQSPEIMDFLITCDMADMGSQTEGTLITTVREDGKVQMEDIIRAEIPFSFDLTDTNESASYHPVNQPDVEGVEIIDVTVNHTELRTYIEITEKINRELWADDIPIFRFSPDGEYKFAGAGGYTEEVEPGVYKFVEEMVKTELGDSFTMELISIFGPNGKTVLDTITFEK